MLRDNEMLECMKTCRQIGALAQVQQMDKNRSPTNRGCPNFPQIDAQTNITSIVTSKVTFF